MRRLFPGFVALIMNSVFADDGAKLGALLLETGVVIIPAGEYHLDGT